MRPIARLSSPRSSPSILQRLFGQGFAPTLDYFCTISTFSCLSAH
ncbi:MAG: hypothetical protein PXX73_08640 [Sideroxydans sp.]|nr:hypothetical protein [Sideroxydans sp.]